MLSLLERYPALSSSPGVKVASAVPEGPGTTTVTNVIFYPHTEHHGIKEAYQALCSRKFPSKSWTCGHVTIRRYVRLASQDFEVRVKGDITTDAALAAIEASRRELRSGSDQGTDRPDTAIFVFPAGDGSYYVHWGTPEGYGRLTVRARLLDGGDPTNPDDWHATINKPAGQ